MVKDGNGGIHDHFSLLVNFERSQVQLAPMPDKVKLSRLTSAERLPEEAHFLYDTHLHSSSR